MSSENKISYRQVGKGIKGQIVRAASVVQARENVASSIPSKYETVLNHNNRETHAFGARTHRFRESDNELPGPGSYYRPPALLKTFETTPSLSRHGYGQGFASKTKRFGSKDNEYDTAPGPGYYTPEVSALGGSTHVYSVAGSSSFASKTKPNEKLAFNNNAPGPGQYFKPLTMGSSKQVTSSIFKSTSKRGYNNPVMGPSPGDYNNPLTLSSELAKKQFQSSFKSSRRCNLNQKDTSPGPGAYEVELAEKLIRQDIVALAQENSAFKSSSIDRFGCSYNKTSKELTDAPGPGSYTTNYVNLTRAAGAAAAAAFRSRSQRFEIKAKTVDAKPGPAYYSPAKGGKQSYMLNSNKKWV